MLVLSLILLEIQKHNTSCKQDSGSCCPNLTNRLFRVLRIIPPLSGESLTFPNYWSYRLLKMGSEGFLL